MLSPVSLENADQMHVATTQPIRPTYRPVALAKLDQRTMEARLMRETRAALVAHVGGKPSAMQAAMIERACQLTLQIAGYVVRARSAGKGYDLPGFFIDVAATAPASPR